MMEVTTGNPNDDGPNYSSGPSEGVMKMIAHKLLQTKTVADVLPGFFQVILTSGKMTGMAFVGAYLAFLGIWFPIYLFSRLVGEMGIYALTAGTIFMVGRSIIRLLAFPGSTNRVSSEIEKEFSKYSVRMINASSISIMDLAQAIASAGNTQSGSQSYAAYEIPAMWKRAKSYRDRVLAVYLEVLQYIYSSDEPSSPTMSNTTKYGNNKLSGDIGDLSGLTLEARADGKRLLEHLSRVISDMDRLEEQAGSMLEQSSGKTQMPSSSVRMIANSLVVVANDLKDFAESLGPSASGEGDASSPNEGDEANLSVDAVRRRFEEQNTSVMDSITSGAASILSMLDPPPHTSIFGFDVQRGCMLARYKGAKQMWVKRPSGGMIDVVHVPATTHCQPSQKNPQAVMYCNPNAGLIEVATGMSLAGGNVMQEEEGVVNDNCWTDFYTGAGYDVYLFNYAGFGRSFGSGYFGVGRLGGEEAYVEGTYGRIKRIIHGTFFGFQPTPATLRTDGLALGTHLISECGVESLVIHGESIGGVAASGTARHLSQTPFTKDKLSLLICDRTFCNLEAVAQRLVGGWSAFAVRGLAPFWSTDVAGDFLAADCRKVVANDSADAIIADPSSLKAGIAWWRELCRGKETTKGVGWIMDAPVQYRMADWENVAVNHSRYVRSAFTRATAPVWPSDKHISLEEAFHFAACTKRLGKIASIEKKRQSMINLVEHGTTECVVPIFLIWKGLACCDGLCGAALGMTVKGGFDCTVSWLCSLLTFGGQTVVEGMEHRQQLSFGESNATKLGKVLTSDFDCRPPGFEKQESDSVVHPKPIPEVLDDIKKIIEDNAGDETLGLVEEELSFIVGTLEYIVARLSSPSVVEQSCKNRHLGLGEGMIGAFMNLHCGHNNPFSAGERSRLRDILLQASGQK
ncbi:unnamed protein product [Cylindrotheca closterium]|uniref:Uncharacterized protein n=1 Tax=Cylindrotheca closterium TaxID=2856 RepID=A0AAD2FLB3_9STRA|nr:unnamed protein product [Cylindrotheca closterium]